MAVETRDQTTRPFGAWLRRALVWLAPFLLALCVYTVTLRVMQPPFWGDQPHYALEAYSLAEDHDRDLANDYASIPRVERVTGESTLWPHAYRYYAGGPLVSYHGPGLPLLLAPTAAVFPHRLTALQLEMILLAAIAAAVLFSILVKLAPERRRLVWAVWAAVVFSLPVLSYSTQLYPEVPAALLVLIVIRILLSEQLTAWRVVTAAAAIAYLPWLHVRFVVLGAGLGLILVVRVVQQLRQAGWHGWPRMVAAAATPVVVGFLLLGVAFNAWYGSPSLAAPLHTSEHIAELTASQAGTPSPAANPTAAAPAPSPTRFQLGNAVSFDNVYQGFFRSLFSARTGWLPFAPVQILGIAAALALAFRRNWWAVLGLLTAAAYLVQIASTGVLPGSTMPARFELIVIPAVAIPLLLAVVRLRWVRFAFWPLAAVSAVITLAGMANTLGLYPSGGGTQRADIGFANVLLRPWPTLSRDPATQSRMVRQEQDRQRHRIGRVATVRGKPVVTSDAAEGAGYLTIGRVERLPAGEYVSGMALGRGTAAAVAGPVAHFEVLVGGQRIVDQPIAADELPVGRTRGFVAQFRTPGDVPVQLRIRSEGRVPLTAGEMFFTTNIDPSSGLGLAGTHYPDVPAVVLWSAVLLGLAAAMAVTWPRPQPSRAT